MATHWGGLKPVVHQKSNSEKWLDWAKAHQELIAVAAIVLLLVGIGIPYVLHSRETSERDSQAILFQGQYYLHAQVDPKNGPFKSDVDRLTQSLQTFQRILTDYSGTSSAKLARYYAAKCEYSLGQYIQAYASFDTAAQELRDVPLGDEAYLGKILCLEAQNQFPQAAVLAEAFLRDHASSFIAGELRLELSNIYFKTNDKAKAVDQLKTLAQTDPDSNWGKEAVRRLKQIQSDKG
ncbi:MAG TPA: tetratricopeptide repeat protein [bacterium]|nr:tetratricopeptide repeat protein [bacterium]